MPDSARPSRSGSSRTLLSRRSILHLSALATVGLAGCGDDGGNDLNQVTKPPTPEVPPVLAAYFEQLLLVREAIRKSPDHTRARADQVVASRDATLIHRFVRDEIALLAPHGALDRPEVGVRWGIEGVLRGGTGTFRERAELLASLYVRAGFTAKVRLGVLPKPIAAEVLFRRPPRVFQPALDEKQIKDLWKSVGKEVPATTAFDSAGVESRKIAAKLLALLPNARANVLTLSSDGLLPMVSVVVEGKEKLAFPYGDLELVDPAPSIVTSDAAPLAPALVVRVVFSMTTATGDVPLVETTLGADALVGKQLMLRAPPPIDPATSFATKAADVHLFVPTLAITSPRSDANAVASTIRSGLAVSDRGDIVKEDASGLYVDGVALSPAGSRGGADGSTVTTATVKANAAAFGTIELLVSATDTAGKPVPTLAASAIRVAEDGVDRSFVVVENAAPKPRVLVVYDTSASIPPAFFEPAGRASFGQSLAQALQDRIPNVELQAVGTAADIPTAAKWGKPTPVELGDAITALAGAGSFVWTAARNAAAAAPAVIVMLTDFQADEKLDPNLAGIKASLPLGAPIVAVAVDTADTQTQAEIATLTGGVSLSTSDPTNVGAIVDAVADLLAKRAAAPYRLSYRAPAQGGAARQVSVSFPKSATAAKAQASYVVPASDKRLPDGGILGLTLTVQVGDELPIKRLLAGIDAADAGQGKALSAAESARIREVLLGTTLVSFEGGAPSESTWVDDYLTAKLSRRPIFEALAAKDQAKVRSALDGGHTFLPQGLDGLHVPPAVVAGSEPVVMERRLRAVIYQFTQKADGTQLHRSDILQSTRLESTSQSAEAAFRQTLEASCRLALGEATVFPESTISLLATDALLRIPAGIADTSTFPAALRPRWKKLLDQYADFDRLVPTSGATLAMWAVDPATGSAFAVLEDGSGGGHKKTALPPGATDPNEYDKINDALGLIGAGPYFIVGKHCARIYVRAGNELVPGYVGPPVNPEQALCDFAKDLAKDGGFGAIGGVAGKALSVADTAREWARLPDPVPGC